MIPTHPVPAQAVFARRRVLLLSALAAGAALALPRRALAARAALPLLEVWQSPTCGCCGDWLAHLHANGFRTKIYKIGNSAVRAGLGMDVKYGSCHTALVAGYAIEGHVPAREILRLLKERPVAVGLAVPGMPIGSPGMDTPVYAGRKDPYDVLLVRRNGSADVYQGYR